MTERRWVAKTVVQAIHDAQLAEHGGAPGIRDETLLESALARPQQIASYGDPDPFDLAATYMVGIISNHPFVDGNKRTGFLVGFTFLDRHGLEISASEAEVFEIVTAIAAGTLNEADVANWLRANVTSP